MSGGTGGGTGGAHRRWSLPRGTTGGSTGGGATGGTAEAHGGKIPARVREWVRGGTEERGTLSSTDVPARQRPARCS